MHAIATRFDAISPHLPLPLRLLINTLILPFLLFWRVPRILWQVLKQHRAEGQSLAPHVDLEDGQFHMDVVNAHEISEFDKVEQEIAPLVKADDWVQVSEKMTKWDASLAHDDGYPLCYAASRAARADQLAFLEQYPDCSQIPASQINLDTLEQLELAFATHHQNHHLAAILARAHVEMAWARRGGDFAHTVTEEGWQGFAMHLERAVEIVDQFDARDLGSPFLAAIQPMIALDSERDPATRREIFDTCLALDSKCWDVMAKEAFHLLPRWGGDYETLEIAARQAMAKTQENGAAAYAAFYVGVLTDDIGALFNCDVELFNEGLNDMAKAEDSDPVFVNRLIQFCFDLTAATFTTGGPEDTEINARRDDFGNCADLLFFRHFTCHIPEEWHVSPEQAHDIMVAMYAPLLTQGGSVSLTLERGIERSDYPQG